MRSNEEVVREAYRLAEGSVLDGPGFRDLFTEDGRARLRAEPRAPQVSRSSSSRLRLTTSAVASGSYEGSELSVKRCRSPG